MAETFEAARISLIPEEIRTVEDRIDYLVRERDELMMSAAKDLVHDQTRSVPKGMKSLERRITYLENRKVALKTMMNNYYMKKGIKGKLLEQDQPAGENTPTSTCTNPSPRSPPSKKLKSKKHNTSLVEHKVNEGSLEGQEQPPGENSPDSIVSDPSLPPLPFRRPLYPHGGDDEDHQVWVEEVERVRKLNAPRDSLPTHLPSVCKCLNDHVTADVVGKDKMMLLPVADLVVSISYSHFGPIVYPGVCAFATQDVIDYCSGMIISWDKPNKKARILTCDYVIGREEFRRKLYVRWHYMPDTVLEGELLFFSEHYRIALIEISVDVQFHIEIPHFGTYPKYDNEVFTLAREHKELSVMVRRGTISRLQESYELRHHFLYVDYELPNCGGGGPVVDHNGDVVGMSLHHTEGTSAVLSISTALSCIEMWNIIGCIPRPSLGMSFKNAERGGFIVETVKKGSAAWDLGIREGNKIVSFDGERPAPLPKFEEFLLSFGFKHLRGMDMKVWELGVQDFTGSVERKVTLRVPFTIVSKGWIH